MALPTELGRPRSPFLLINPKAYLTGAAIKGFAIVADGLAAELDVDVVFTAQHVDLAPIAGATTNLIVAAQHLDPMGYGRGMGHILPEGVIQAGARAVVLNHAEHPLSLGELDAAMRRAEEVGLTTIVCADSIRQCRAVAQLDPAIVICEPTVNIGTGVMAVDDYITESTAAVKAVNPDILVVQGAGVGTGADVTRMIRLGADAAGTSSGLINAADRSSALRGMIEAVAQLRDEREV